MATFTDNKTKLNLNFGSKISFDELSRFKNLEKIIDGNE